MMGFFAKNGRSASPEVSKLAHKRGSIGSKDEVFATPGKPASASPMTTAADGSSPNISRSAIKPFSLAASGSGSKPRNEMSDFDKAFKPFNVKTTVTMAPVNRFAASDKAEIEVKVGSDLSLTREGARFLALACVTWIADRMAITSTASLSDFLRNVPEYRRPVGPRRIVPRLTVREVLRQMAEAEMAGDVEGSRRWRGALNDRQRLPVKTLCFHEDVRPGYVGTWTKATRSVRPLKPFGKDTCLLNYEYDSEGDWEEDDAEGEDLNDEEEEEEGEAMSEADSEEDGWLVADDDVEMADATSDAEPDDIVFMGATGELADQQQKRKRALQEQKKKAVAAKKRRIVGPLIPIIKGPLWEERLGQVESQTMEPFRIQFLNGASRPFLEFIGRSQGSRETPFAQIPGSGWTRSRLCPRRCTSLWERKRLLLRRPTSPRPQRGWPSPRRPSRPAIRPLRRPADPPSRLRRRCPSRPESSARTACRSASRRRSSRPR